MKANTRKFTIGQKIIVSGHIGYIHSIEHHENGIDEYSIELDDRDENNKVVFVADIFDELEDYLQAQKRLVEIFKKLGTK